VSCAPSGPSGGGQSRPQEPAQQTTPSGPKILAIGINEDPKNMWDGINGGGGGGAREIGHLVNQYLAVLHSDGTPEARLLAEMPSVDRGTWQVLPDGKMEVTYKVRPGVTWHDGAPFTADDIVISWEICKDPAIPNGNQAAVRLIERVVALDPQTAVATWSATYAFADRLEHREFYPLPKHLVERAYRENKEAFVAQPYFGDEYVGLGPFKLTSWEHGAFMDLSANEQYFLGRPKLDRIRVNFVADANTAVANLRAGVLNTFLPEGGPELEQLQPVEEEWRRTGRGSVITETVRWRFIEPQKSAAAQPGDLRDVRVRQALLMAINRDELAHTLDDELGMVADSWVHPKFSYYPAVRDAIVTHPFDIRRATALLAEAGWTPGSDGILQKGGTRFQLQIRPEQDSSVEREAAIVQQYWRAIGVDGNMEILPAALLRDAEARASFTGVYVNRNPMGGLSAARRFAGDQIPTAANRFAGTNRGSFASADWDSISNRLRTALEDSRRVDIERELLQVFGAELPALPTHYQVQAVPVGGFKGYVPITGAAHTGNIMHTWNAHEWELTS
jgi:peptide/nickel transport system substrate-binding protein